MARRVLTAVAVIMTACILLTMFAGCNKEKTPEEEFSLAQKKASAIDTENFYCFKEFIGNEVLKNEGIDVEDYFIKIGRDNQLTVHVLSLAKEYTVYTVESKQLAGIINAIPSEKNYIYVSSRDENGEEIFLQWRFNEAVWNAWYDVEGDRILFEP